MVCLDTVIVACVVRVSHVADHDYVAVAVLATGPMEVPFVLFFGLTSCMLCVFFLRRRRTNAAGAFLPSDVRVSHF